MPETNAHGSRQRATVLMATNTELLALQEKNGFSDAVIIGDDVTLSGVIAALEDGETNIEAAFTRTFEAIGATLRRAGATWDDVVDITSFHTDLGAQLDAFVAVKSRYVTLPHPAWTAIGITRLVSENGLVETRVRARLSGPAA
jgi:enamine deaminase RidA (YjgF/YER057c/UK114 family)